MRALRELGRSYLALTQDSTRVMNRIKSVYRSWAIACGGSRVYSRRHRAEWLAKLAEPGVRMRAEHLYQELDHLEAIRQVARRELLRESRKHAAVELLRQIPAIGPIRSALLVAILQTPHRLRGQRQLWAYAGFAVQTYDSGEFRFVRGKRQRNRERITVRGLNRTRGQFDVHVCSIKNVRRVIDIWCSRQRRFHLQVLRVNPPLRQFACPHLPLVFLVIPHVKQNRLLQMRANVEQSC